MSRYGVDRQFSQSLSRTYWDEPAAQCVCVLIVSGAVLFNEVFVHDLEPSSTAGALGNVNLPSVRSSNLSDDGQPKSSASFADRLSRLKGIVTLVLGNANFYHPRFRTPTRH